MTDEYDLIVRNGLIVDGTGEQPFRGDVAVREGVIRAVGQVAGTAKIEIDADAGIVTPGFVDLHTHYDGQAIWSSRLNPSSSHGVTTIVVGNCGVGFAPCRPTDHDLLLSVMEGVEDIPNAVMADGLDWKWETFPEYLDSLESRPHDIDIAAYLPHSPLRVYVMGERGARNEPATNEDLAAMRAITAEAVKAGAVGFATSRMTIHKTTDGKPIPSYEAPFTEIEAIASAMTEAGGGLIQFVPDIDLESWRFAVNPFIEIGRQTGRPLSFSMVAPNHDQQSGVGWPEVKQVLDDASSRGVEIFAQAFPRPIGMILGLSVSAHPFCLCPSYLEIKALPLSERVARMRDPDFRARLVAEQPIPGHPLSQMARDFDWMFLMEDPPNYEPDAEMSIGSMARAQGVAPETLAYDRLIEDDGRKFLWTALGNFPEHSLDVVGEMLEHPNMTLGLGDGGAHYGMICDSSYPTFVLTHWTRERAGTRMTLPRAVRLLTRDPAERIGFLDRGLIAPGYKADINVIDYDHLTLHSPYVVADLPAGGRRIDQRASGYLATIVSGEVIARDGEPTGRFPGRLVRGSRPQPSTPG